MKSFILPLSLFLVFAEVESLPNDVASTGGDWVTPAIRSEGKVVALPQAAFQPQRGSKAVFDISAQESSNEIAEGLVRAARWLNLNAVAGIDPRDINIVLVLHGDATKAALTHRAYAEHADEKRNPSLDLLQELKRQGAELYVCGQALARHGYALPEVAPGIEVATAALTVIVQKQQQGYAFLPY